MIRKLINYKGRLVWFNVYSDDEPRTGNGPWHLADRDENLMWYIVNDKTNAVKKIGPARIRGTNYHDKAIEEAIRLNEEVSK